MGQNKTELRLQELANDYKKSGDDYSVKNPRALKIHVKRDLTYNEREHRNVVEKEPRRIREDPVAFMLNVGLYYQGTGWRGYKNYIGTKILYPRFSNKMKQLVLDSKKVKDMIDKLADQQTETIIAQKKWQPNDKRVLKQRKALKKEIEVVTKQIADKAVATVDSLPTLRFFAFVVNNILVRLYHQGVHIRESEWVELKRIALLAQEKKQSLIFLPSHKSHIDYLVVSYLMFRLGIQIPHIVAGDNLDMPIVGKLLKSSGAVFIRREWGNDELYKTVLEEYMATLLNQGINFECFVEGTRSRLGKLLQPKLGVVKIILDALIENRFSDCHIVPISIGYDKIIETSSYATELLGTPKEKESLWGVLTNSRLLQLKWGRVDVRLGKPYSLKEWLDDQIKMRGQVNTKLTCISVLLKSLGYRVLADINAISVVMPSALVGTVILTLRGRGVGRSELIRRVDWLRKIIDDKGGQVSEFHGMSTGEIVDKTVVIHKDLIGERKGKDIVEPTFYPIAAFELSYYRNQVIHLFVEEAIVCAALYTVVKKGGGKPLQRMQYEDLLDEISFLSSLLKLDMIYKPGGVESNTRRTIQWLADNHVIEITGDGWVGLNDIERQCGRENYDFLCFMIWPFIESYWLAAVSLFTLAPPSMHANQKPIWVDSKLFANRTQSLGKTLYYQGDLSYLEAVNKETLNNAFIRYEEKNILLKKRYSNPKPWSEVAISNEYTPERQNGILMPRGHLWGLVERIGRFRREGKNRRDNATVSTRVLRLADMLGEHNTIPTANQKAANKKSQQDSKL
ncbi:MAG: glycerol-3-phosphate acyltransferase [Benjaminiella poitrasii]|nr:MAG: glycerol-3-phosphate acyltransferase [Benjaminiella poitrasii]